MGNRALGRLLLPDAMLPPNTPHTLQRDIGIEAEVGSLYSYEASFPYTVGGAVDNIANASAQNPIKKAHRIPKGKALIKGAGFELQGEDAPGNPKLSNSEFVSTHFPETNAGYTQFVTMLNGVMALATAIGAKDPTTVFGIEGAGLPGTVAKSHGILDNQAGPTPDVWKIKPQITIGVSLEKIAQLMTDLFKGSGPETADQTARLQAGRQKLGAEGGTYGLLIGDAPARANAAIDSFYAGLIHAPPPSPALRSLMGLIVAYMDVARAKRKKMAHSPPLNGVPQPSVEHEVPLVSSYAKTVAPIMARTDFAAMFNLLPDAEKAFLRDGDGINWLTMFQSIPGLNNLNVPIFEHGITIDDNTSPTGYRIDKSMDALTRRDWLTGMIDNVDLLTQYHFPDKKQRENVEGLGALKGATDKVGPAMTPGAILELRAMPYMPLDQFKNVAIKTFMTVFFLNSNQDLKYGE